MEFRKIQVLLVDPDDAFAVRVTRAFKSLNGRTVLARAHTLAEARALSAATHYDVAIADFTLPDGAATDLLCCEGDRTGYPVIVLVPQGEERSGAKAIAAGAIDWFAKNGGNIADLPRVALRSVREWNHIAERERAEKTISQLRAQVSQFQQLVSSGLMARGVAHDMENLLTPILGYAEDALEKIPPRGNARGEVEQVIRVARLAKEIVRDALSKGKNGNQARTPVDVSGIVEDVLDLLRPVAPAGVEIRSGVLASAALVAADAAQIHRVVMNLCMNAFDAMRSSGGVLQVDVETGVAAHPRLEGNSFVRVTVTDTGHGIHRDSVDRVFDPFFTTKPKGEGLGLGLSLVREIVKAQNGDVSVESQPGKGSVFQLHLPHRSSAGASGDGADHSHPGRASVVL
jgi:signal transduction histidine kinase